MRADYNLILILLLPLVSALICGVFLRKNGALASKVSVLTAYLIAGLSLLLLINWNGVGSGETLHYQMNWFNLGGFGFKMGFLVDQYAATMLLVVSVVGALIHQFSMGYMDDDKAKARFFGGLSIFMFSMLGIVLADNLLMMFVFWELVGFSSYALIAHYKDTKEASLASKKAFIVNRVGDFGFIIGIVWCYWQFGSVDFLILAQRVGADAGLMSSGMAFLLICGFLGKSAQFPLQVWLPDAMAGPTPVSALIHAATMVAAGIYLLIRIFFLIPEDVLNVIMWLGAGMTAYAGFCALGQNDIKKILAYSTLSQLGYMALAVGLGFPGLALFHLATHACFKALLFLGAGSVIHALHHEQDIFQMGGLLKKMPVTGVTFLIGLIALCGVTFTSGYFSKDAIIEGAYFGHRGVFYLVLFSALLTSIYMGRLFYVAFLGKANSKVAEKAHESGLVMTLPLIVLAVFSLCAGYVNLWPEHWAGAFLKELHFIHKFVNDANLSVFMLVLTSSTWVLGLIVSYIFYRPGAKVDELEKKVPVFYNLCKSKLYFDEVYNFYVKRIQQRVADFLGLMDVVFISGVGVRGTAGLVGLMGILFKKLHVGRLNAYVYWFLLGIGIFGAFAFGLFG